MTSAALNGTEADAVDAAQDLEGVREAGALAGGQVVLAGVAGDDRAGAGADAGQEHLHLLRGGVLRLVEDQEGLAEGPPAHVGQRGDLDDALLHHAQDLLDVEHVVEGVVQRAHVRADLLLEGAGEEAEVLAGLDGRAGEDDPADALVHQHAHAHRDGEVGLAGAGGADPEVRS
jgi:hypothetical protein